MLAILAASALAVGVQAKPVEGYWFARIRMGISGMEREEDRLYLFPNGFAMRGYHEKGVDGMDVSRTNATGAADRYGTWTKSGGSLHIRWGGGVNPETFTSEGQNYSGSGVTWRPLKRVDGLRFHGLFAREDPKEDGAQLMLRSDGTFAIHNAHRIGMILTATAPNDGSGTYDIRNWTLYLRFSNGQKGSMLIEVPHTQEPKSATFLNLGTWNFYRFPGELNIAGAPATGTPGVERTEKIFLLSMKVPGHWKRIDNDQIKATLLMPQGVPAGAMCVLTVTAPEEYKGSDQQLHSSMWGAITNGLKRDGGYLSEKHGVFIRSWAMHKRQDGSTVYIGLYTTVVNGKSVVAMFSTDRQELFFRHFDESDLMLKAATIVR